MSATMTPPAPIIDTATQPAPQRVVVVPARPRSEPAAPSSRATHPSRFRGLGDALFFTAWASALTVAGLVVAAAMAVAAPILMGRVLYEERKYR